MTNKDIEKFKAFLNRNGVFQTFAAYYKQNRRTKVSVEDYLKIIGKEDALKEAFPFEKGNGLFNKDFWIDLNNKWLNAFTETPKEENSQDDDFTIIPIASSGRGPKARIGDKQASITWRNNRSLTFSQAISEEIRKRNYDTANLGINKAHKYVIILRHGGTGMNITLGNEERGRNCRIQNKCLVDKLRELFNLQDDSLSPYLIEIGDNISTNPNMMVFELDTL